MEHSQQNLGFLYGTEDIEWRCPWYEPSRSELDRDTRCASCGETVRMSLRSKDYDTIARGGLFYHCRPECISKVEWRHLVEFMNWVKTDGSFYHLGDTQDAIDKMYGVVQSEDEV